MQLMKLLSVGAVVSVLAFAVPGFGASVPNLYSAQVPLASKDQLDRAFSAALAEVLVKVTGRRDIGQDQAVLGAIAEPAALVQQYRVNPDGKVWVQFDRVALKRFLDNGGHPIWGDDRPSTLVWLVVDTGGGRREILPAVPDVDGEGSAFSPATPDRASRSARVIRDRLLASASRRGLPLILPLVDTEDLRRVSVSDIWGGFADSIERASVRYGADGVLIGRATVRSGGSAQVRWTLLRGAERSSWNGDVASGPGRLADTLAARLATSRSGSRQLFLRVDGVDSLAAYGRVTDYLKKLSLVESCAVASVENDVLLLELDVRGDADRLMRALALRNVLQLDSTTGGEPVMGATGLGTPDLHYRLMP